MLYRCRQLKKNIKGRDILNIEDLHIDKGRIYSLLGANGAGKTTLLNILAFLDSPTNGQLEFMGNPVSFTPSSLYLLRKNVILVDQHPVMFSTTVYKNIEFGLKIRKIKRVRRQTIINDVLELVGLTSFKNELAHNLSGGEVQRAALARALALNPGILLCDEPTANVDSENQAAIIRILRDINQEKKISILFTTHDQLQASALAESTVILSKGKVVSGRYDNIFTCTAIEYSSTALRCILSNNAWVILPKTQCSFPGSYQITIRPESIEFAGNVQDGDSLSFFNGVVLQLTAEGDAIQMEVNVGVLLTVRLTKKRYAHYHPAIGDVVNLRVPGEAVRVRKL